MNVSFVANILHARNVTEVEILDRNEVLLNMFNLALNIIHAPIVNCVKIIAVAFTAAIVRELLNTLAFIVIIVSDAAIVIFAAIVEKIGTKGIVLV